MTHNSVKYKHNRRVIIKLKKPLFILICIFSVPFLLNACASKTKLQPVYEKAVRDASIAERNEIADDLIAVNTENTQLVWNENKTKILVVTWKSRESYEKYFK